MNTALRILSYLKPYWRRMIVVYIALLIAVAGQTAIPLVLGEAIDRGVANGDTTFLWQSALFLIGLAVLQGGFTFVRSFHLNVLAERVANDLRNQLYAKFQGLPFQFYDQAQTGQLMSRATEDILQIRGMLLMGLRAVPHGLALLIIITVLLLREHVLLALVALSTTPVLLFWSFRFGVTIRPMFLKVQQQFGVMTSTLQENVAGGRVVRAFAQEAPESNRFEEELESLFQRNVRASNHWSFHYPLTLAMNGLSIAGVVWVGGYLALTGQVSIGTLVAFERYTALLNEPVRWLGFVVNRVARALAAGERIFEVLDRKPAITDSPDAKPIEAMRGEVRFEHVSFAYTGGHGDALDDVSFEAHPGQITALVGPTGSGKSSVVNLIPRFYDPAEGRVLIDDIDVRDIKLASLRSNIGVVMQESFLFSMTVRENIAYGQPDATDEDVIAAAKAAQAHDFITRMENGYDSLVGERGVTLSGGQKQRLAIARALLLNPRILILDDATASVDSETEHEIQTALRTLMAGRTSFVIAQRLTTVRDADQILVFEDGRITQRGTHDELLAQEGFYRELYELQMKDQEEAARPGAVIEDEHPSATSAGTVTAGTPGGAEGA
ncbi:MAG: ABC transporter ATP-binding protein/permease [Chloroflexota bacterium]|nr:ABC transporter ATP-binding protein/permease [Chloroflexota bacterium]